MSEARRTWNQFRTAAKIPDVTIHALRRTLGSRMAIMGASLPVIARALGHELEQSSIAAVYARLNNEPVREAIQKAVKTLLERGHISF